MKRIILLFMLMVALTAWAGDGNGQVKEKTALPMPTSIVKLNIGPVVTVSKVYVQASSWSSPDLYEDVTGLGGTLSWIHMGGHGIGYGFDFYANRTVYTSYAKQVLLSLSPNVTGALGLGKVAMLVGSVGLGAVYSHSNDQTDLGFCWRLSAGMDFRLSESFGLGIEWFMQRNYLKKPTGLRLPGNERYGFDHAGVLLGVRFYH